MKYKRFEIWNNSGFSYFFDADDEEWVRWNLDSDEYIKNVIEI